MPKDVVSKIAAGEVIHRPSAVIKELIENSLDAKSKTITIELKNFGLDLIKVSDDGTGMEKEDIALCFKQFTTSKISNLEDLSFISSYGFRGEALYSISHVSNLILKSRPKGQSFGYTALLKGGELLSFDVSGMRSGTQVIAEDLFINLPPRRAFLSAQKHNFQAILNTIIPFLFSHPQVSFLVLHNGKEVLNAKKGTLKTRIGTAFGSSVTNGLIALNTAVDDTQISGFISHPGIRFPFRNNMFTYVNDRCISSLTLRELIKKAYSDLLDAPSFPLAVVFVNMPASKIDANIHPRKEEVLFFEEKKVNSAIFESVTRSLRDANLAFGVEFVDDKFKESYKGLSEALSSTQGLFLKGSEENEVLQIGNLYLLCAKDNKILIFDQHATHEKILFNELKKEFEKGKNTYHRFDTPVIIDIPLNFKAVLDEHLDLLNGLGFEIEEFGTTTYRVSLVPYVLSSLSLDVLLLEIVNELSQIKTVSNVDSMSHKLLATIACRSAIKAGDKIDPETRKKLVEKAMGSDFLDTCPHGRPVRIELSIKELDKFFKRK
mgnify:FL=1